MLSKDNTINKIENHSLSLFKNGKSNTVQADITILQLLDAVKSGRINDTTFSAIIDNIRQEPDKEKRKALKLTLPAVTVSGCFEKTRKAANLINHSGFIQIDFDNITEPERIKEKLQKDVYTFALFTSPSGNGLKAIVRIPPEASAHLAAFQSLERYYFKNYGLQIDKACKDVSRLMFLSYDPDIYINQGAALYEALGSGSGSGTPAPAVALPPSNGHEDKQNEVERIISEIEKRRLDITAIYGDWIKIGFAFATYFGENGRIYFHRVSRYNTGYDYTEADKQFDECLKDRQAGKAGINSFFHIAKQAGVDISRENNNDYYNPGNDYIKQAIPASMAGNGKPEKIENTNSLLAPIEINQETKTDNFLKENGFIISENGYIVEERVGKGKTQILISNFTMQFLYQFPDGGNNAKYLIKLQNKFRELALLEITAKDITSLNGFKAAIKSKGNFHIYGNPTYHFDRIQEYHNLSLKAAKEIAVLGYQPEGNFYAFSNGIITENNEFKPIDNMGMVEHGNHTYYLPAYSELNKESDHFVNERKFVCKPGNIDLFNYCQLMNRAYNDKSILGISYIIAAIFRDIVYNHRQTFPYLFLFGLPGAGKTSFTDLLLTPFGVAQDGVSLSNISTIKGVARKTAQLKNALIYFKEYSNAGMNNELIHFLKTAYDGIGYERAQTSNDNRTDTTRVNSGIIIDGNELPEKNSAVLSRCILLQFSKLAYTREQREAFNQLKKEAEAGFGNVFLEIWKYRSCIDRDFESTYKSILHGLKQNECKGMDNERLPEHVSLLLAPFQIMEMNGAKFPFNSRTLLDELLKAAENQNEIFHQTNEIQQFLNMVEILANEGKIYADKHYRPETRNPNVYSFAFNEIYSKCLEHARKTGLTLISENSLKSIMTETGYFLPCEQKGRKYSKIDNVLRKSCYRLDMEKAGIILPVTDFATLAL